MEKFIYLKEPFKQWIKDKRDKIEKLKSFDLNKNEQDLLFYDGKIDIKLIDKILKYLSELGPPEFMKILLKRFAYYYGNYIPKGAPILVNAELQVNYIPNALNWTIINVAALRFFDMNDIDEYIKPYKQCLYCGQPYEYEHKTGKKKFNNKVKYCHDKNCDALKISGASSPNLHENCHYGMFAKMRKKIYQQMRTAKITQEEKIKIFIDFCEERLKSNEKILWSVQTEKIPAKNEDEWYNI